jgi:hypothetical protein
MAILPRSESASAFEQHLSRAWHAVYLAGVRAALEGYEGAAQDLAGMQDLLSTMLHDSAGSTVGGRRRLRSAGPA